MSDTDETLLDVAVEVARADSEVGIAPDRARAVLARIEGDIAKPTRWRLVLVPALAFVAAIAALSLRAREPDRPAPSEAIVAVASLRYMSGTPAWDSSQPARAVELSTDQRLDLSLPAGRAILHGPARARFTADIVLLDEGRIALSIDPRRPTQAPFVVRAPDGEVVVHGTMFEVVVASGHLVSVGVDHGKVEVRRGTDAVFVGAKQRTTEVAVVRDAPVTIAGFDAPWWTNETAVPAVEGTVEGVVEIQIAPPGGAITIDGVALGSAPLVVAWKFGSHVVQASGHEAREAMVGRGERTRLLFEGPKALGAILARSPEVERCASRQLFRFAVGRPDRPEDQATIEGLNAQLKLTPRLTDLVLALVETPGIAHRLK